ncbi:unnamed protein product [Clavelina lepadiformis]|uniref:RNA helicase n=1 Tax=Clavelina lepadiformis TaxID=159417 RepID=A0ABP0H3M8_CLALP
MSYWSDDDEDWGSPTLQQTTTKTTSKSCHRHDENFNEYQPSNSVKSGVPETISFGRGRRSDDSRKSRSYRNGRSFQENSQQYFNKTGSGEKLEMTVHPNDCGRIIGRGGSKIKEIQEKSATSIKVCKDRGDFSSVPVIINGAPEARELAKKLIEDIINSTDDRRIGSTRQNVVKENGPETNDGLTPDGFIDWDAINELSEQQTKARWANLPDVLKKFYIEDDIISDMTKSEVNQWRENNFQVSVSDLSEENRAPLNPVMTFEQAFQHYPDILTEIYKQGFKKPSPIQSQMWPIALSGYDVIGIAQTGTGKTLGFLLPAFIHIDVQKVPREKREGPSAVVLTPTRELALQIEQEIKKYSYHGIRCVCVYGGGDRRKQINQVMSGVEIIVATPGRFNDLLACEVISLKSVTFLVLDEADRMLDLGFEPQIMKILIDIRPDRQTLMTSATWPAGVRRLARSYLTNPFQVNVGSLDLAATHTVQQIIEIIDEEKKRHRLLEFINDMEANDKVLVFVGRKLTCDDVASDLCLRDIACQSIHGGREQYDREQALEDFKTGEVRILIATDVASRGLDVKDISHVFNMDFPRNTEEYVHRVGRTGRAGRTGVSLSLFTRNDWASAKPLIDILEEAQQDVPIELHEMAERYGKMKQRRGAERGNGGFRGNRQDFCGGRSRGGGRRGRW